MSDTPKLADIIPAPARRIVYTVLGFGAAVSAVAIAALTDGFQVDDIPVLIAGTLSAGGFTLANANTPR